MHPPSHRQFWMRLFGKSLIQLPPRAAQARNAGEQKSLCVKRPHVFIAMLELFPLTPKTKPLQPLADAERDFAERYMLAGTVARSAGNESDMRQAILGRSRHLP